MSCLTSETILAGQPPTWVFIVQMRENAQRAEFPTSQQSPYDTQNQTHFCFLWPQRDWKARVAVL